MHIFAYTWLVNRLRKHYYVSKERNTIYCFQKKLRSNGLVLGVPNLGDASHWGDAKGLISVISWEHLYQWGDAIDVRGDADTIRLGTPGLVIKAEDSWLRGLSSNPPLKTQSFMHHSFESKERSKSKEWNVLTYPALLHVLSNPVNGKLAYKIQLKYEPAGQLIRTKFWPKNSFHNN